jgi:microcystin-dependent protein
MGTRYLGQVLMTGYDTHKQATALPDFAACDGALIAMTQNEGLFALLGTFYGGDGRSTFALPDLRGRAPIGAGPSQDPAWQPPSWVQGQQGGAEKVALTGNQGAHHGHGWNATNLMATANTIPGSLWGTANDPNNPSSNFVDIYSETSNDPVPQDPSHMGPTGASVPHNNMQPYLTLCFSIALAGVYPG